MGSTALVIFPTASPTPESLNSNPSVARNCGRIAAQPMCPSSLSPSRNGTAGLRCANSAMPTASATTAATPRPMIVAMSFSSSSCPPTCTLAKPTAKTTATSGMSRAGMNSLLPYLSANRLRSSGLVVCSVPLPGKPKPASPARDSTAMPSTSEEPVPETTHVP